jgi:hypothetical protein
VTVTSGSALQIDLAFDAGSGGRLDSAEIYVAVVTPAGLFWLDPVRGFTRSLARLRSGPLPTFGPSSFITIADVSTLGPGGYIWLVLVDEQIDGGPTGEISDFVFTELR